VRLEDEHRQQHQGADEECVDRRMIHEDHRLVRPVMVLMAALVKATSVGMTVS
jgi:hypothetical protein